MRTTLTIRNLDETVKQKLRIRAATHGRSMEAEAREILTAGVKESVAQGGTATVGASARGKFDHLIGIWKGRGTTDALVKELRGRV